LEVALTAELFGGNKGLGYLLNLARQDFDTPLILVVILIIVIFVYTTERFIFKPVENSLAEQNAIS
jgi:NitT/TauT family transport system permease protein/sulfonate transport system permease protein